MASGLVRLLTAASVAGLTSITGVASAQEAPPTLPGQGQADIDPARRLPPVRQNEAAATGAPRADCPLAGQGAITLSAVIAEGATYVSQAEVDAAVADLLNRELDLAVLCQARDRVAQLYAHRGQQLVRVDLPEQRISGGVLRLKVTEGYLARTTVEQPHAQGPSAALAAGYLARLEAQRPADWADVERAFYLIRDIPGAEVDLRLRRSDAGPGAVEAVAAFHPRRKFDVTLGAQRLGSEELGETTVFGRLDANSFTPFGERTSLVVQSSTSGEQLVVQLLEELRVGSSGLVALADVAYGRSRPAGALEPLEIEGESLVARLGLRYPVIAGRERAVNVGARFEAIDQQNDLGILRGIPGVSPVLFDEQLRVISADADTRWRPRRAPGFTASAGVELRKGVEGLGSSEAGDPALSRAEGDPAFGVLKAQARLRHQFAPGAGGPWLSGAFMGQLADGPLPAYEEFQIGNYSIGRGYTPGAASGDKAVGAQLEAGWTFGLGRSVMEPFAFVDAASLANEDTGGYDSDIWSVGAGVRARIASVDISVVYASPQSEPLPGAPRPDDRLLITLSRVFSFR